METSDWAPLHVSEVMDCSIQPQIPVFLTGGSGYLGSRLAPALAASGATVYALTRRPIARPHVVETYGNALDARTFAAQVPTGCRFVHLVGTPRPAPWKERAFRQVDLVSFRASLQAAKAAQVCHFVYVSVAHPAPVMQAYIRVRMECEALLAASGLAYTILRPWYVLGPGHRWPAVLKPLYALAARVPAWRDGASRLSLVTVEEMIGALHQATLHRDAETEGNAIWEPAQIRALGQIRQRQAAYGTADAPTDQRFADASCNRP